MSRVRTFANMNEDSNAAFSEAGFDSDSNQTFEVVNYACQKNNGSTDFSALRQQEMSSAEKKP